MRIRFYWFSLAIIALVFGVHYAYYPPAIWAFALIGPVFVVGIRDSFQTRHTIRRNFPVIGHFRYLLEAIRPEINQYFIESNSDGVPFSREQRSIVYQRSKKELDTLPFGTQKDVYAEGYEWATHSLAPVHVPPESLRVTVGGPQCSQPYSASILNVSAMSYGALSRNAILALNGGAKIGGFAHNTGEGGLSPYHLRPQGDLIWQIGTGYFSCRDRDGKFEPRLFEDVSAFPSVKMIELKLSQGAKPSHGGILPAAKVTREISEIRGVPIGKTVISPPAHSAFTTPVGLCEFLGRLRHLSKGKPVGFKLCVGKKREFVAICKAMKETGILPDFITVDGGEGGTGAAPLEFSNYVGYPLRDGLVLVHNTLVGFGLRDKIRILCSGRMVTGFDMITAFALGADLCNSARAMMMALGCIQALRCNSNKCPAGVATQDPELVRGLVVDDKKRRVANFHAQTLHSAAEIMGSIGVKSPQEIQPWHVLRRTGRSEIKNFEEIYPFLKDGVLLQEPYAPGFVNACRSSSPHTFQAVASTRDAGLAS